MTSYDLSEHRSMHCLLLWSHYSIVYFITENFKNYAYSMILLIIKDLISNKITASSTVDYVEVTASERAIITHFRTGNVFIVLQTTKNKQ